MNLVLKIITVKTQKKGCAYSLLVLAAIFLIVVECRAEGIFLQNGSVLYGKVLSQDTTMMQIRTSYGIINIKKAEIKKIDYDLGLGTVTVVRKDGTLVGGTLISITASKVIIRDNNIDHEISRNDIENLVLQKFEGRRDNIFGVMGGFLKTTGSVKRQVPYGNVDISVFYLRSSSEIPYFQWGMNVSYIKLKTDKTKAKLEKAEMTLNPFLIDFRLKYPILSLLTSSDIAGKTDFFINCGAGISYVTLKEGNDSRTDSYFTVQPGVGMSVSYNEHIYAALQGEYLYIHQSALSYSGLRTRLGVGYIF